MGDMSGQCVGCDPATMEETPGGGGCLVRPSLSPGGRGRSEEGAREGGGGEEEGGRGGGGGSGLAEAGAVSENKD